MSSPLPTKLVPHTDADYDSFIAMCNEGEENGFVSKYNKKGIQVWIKTVKGSPVKMFKVATVIESAMADVSDVLQDEDYRSSWDPTCIESRSVYQVGPSCTLDYYSGKSPRPLKNRDSVTLRSWRNTEKEVMIICSSVEPGGEFNPTKKFIRAFTSITGHRLSPTADGKTVYTWICHFDPRGDIPKMLVNFIATKMAPKSITALAKATTTYPAWKEKSENKPDHKPWNSTGSFLPALPAEMQGEMPEMLKSQISSEHLNPEAMAAADAALAEESGRNSVEYGAPDGDGDGGDGGGAALGAEPGLLGAEPELLGAEPELLPTKPKLVEL